MIKLLSTKDCKNIQEFLELPSKDQYYVELFRDYHTLRHHTFESKIISVGEVTDGKITKLLSILTPEKSTLMMCCTIIAVHNDKEFVKEALSMLTEILEDEEYSKFKITFYNGRFNEFEKTLEKCNFVKEVEIDDVLRMTAYSYYL
ncbi:MAG: hypothetical protein E7Z66_01730 [Thermoplasmata archaeon]|nr:hypothetical protein [Thermoplasmata archaeon]